jgi:hypothetical protein
MLSNGQFHDRHPSCYSGLFVLARRAGRLDAAVPGESLFRSGGIGLSSHER